MEQVRHKLFIRPLPAQICLWVGAGVYCFNVIRSSIRQSVTFWSKRGLFICNFSFNPFCTE